MGTVYYREQREREEMSPDERVMCDGCGVSEEIHLAQGWVSIRSGLGHTPGNDVGTARFPYRPAGILLPMLDPEARCYCPECALHIEVEDERDLSNLKSEHCKGYLDLADALVLRQGLVREARKHLVHRVLQMNYGTYWDNALGEDYPRWFGIQPTLRDEDGWRTRVRVEILEGTTMSQAIASLREALDHLEAAYEQLVDWPAERDVSTGVPPSPIYWQTTSGDESDSATGDGQLAA